MSVYIKGMEMPKAGVYSCELGVLDENTAVLTIYTPIDEPQRSYKLVPVPPHGRLIDANAIPYVESEDGVLEDYAFRYDINELPTIIPAEEGE